MEIQEGYKVTYSILSIFRYFFLVAPVIVVLATTLSLIKIKEKSLRKIFNYKDTTNGLITLFTLFFIFIPTLVFCLYRVTVFLKEKGKAVEYSLVTGLIMPILSLKAPDISVITGEIVMNAHFIFPVIVLAILGLLIKRKDTASKTMIIMAVLDLLLLLVTYRLYITYFVLFGIRIGY